VNNLARKKELQLVGEQSQTEPHTSFCVDWISATIKENPNAGAFDFLACFDEISPRRVVKALHGYTNAYRWQFGALMMWHATKKSMGVHIILSGSTLRALHDKEYDAFFMLKRLIRCNAKLTMVHLALDIVDSTINPTEFYQLFKAKQYSGRAQTASIIENIFGGQTCYIGSWNSERFFRIYDKAAEQSIKGLNWKRLELVLKGDYAQAFAYQFASEKTVERAMSVFRGAVKAMADFPHRDWIRALEGRIEKLSLPEGKERKTREWLLTQVVSAMAKYVVETGDDTLIEEFAREYEAAYEKAYKQAFPGTNEDSLQVNS